MDFEFTPEQEKLRQEVQEFLEKELPRDKFPKEEDQWIKGWSPEFSRKLGKRGWIGMTFPKEYGGGGRSYLDRLIVTEELCRRGAPCAAHWFGDRQMGPCILAYGSEEQKRKFLPGIVNGELYFCAGMSEPDAGSDLASLKTQAVEEGDEFIITGQKVWISHAVYPECHYIWVLARTDLKAPKHRGISEFIVDLHLPGITVRPLINIAGEAELAEVFFDDVRIPKECLVGEKNRGWYQITPQLDYERSGIERLMGNYPLLEDITNHARETGLAKEPKIRHKLADLLVRFEVGRLLVYRAAWLLSQGTLPNYETAMTKTYCTEFEKDLANVITQIGGLYGQLMPGSKFAWFSGRPAKNYLCSVGYTIQAGTSEILRNVVAIRGLGLPTA